MNTSAIHQALRLEKHPEEMAWLCYPDSDLPEGVTDLLRICASKELLEDFSETNTINVEELSISLINFINKVILNNKNSDEKILGTDDFSPLHLQKLHYHLLMNIFDPDQNKDSDTLYHSDLIEKAYQNLETKEKEREIIRFSESRQTTKKYSTEIQKNEPHISHLKTAIAIVSAISICIIVAMTGKLNDPANPELVTKSVPLDQNEVVDTQNLLKITTQKNNNTPEKSLNIQASSTQLQSLLTNLENAYEKGNVKAIMPIIANTPEIKKQTTKQLHDKLETIFEITKERKMVLFNFKWKNVSGKLEGQGKFLSRYLLVGEKKWLTRKGVASISAELNNNKLKVIQLNLENQDFE